MKKIVVSYVLITEIMLLTANVKVKAQNLVPNPSFEIYDTCPKGDGYPGQDSLCVGWSSYANTPDYFNACAAPSTYVNVPYTIAGFRNAATGKAFCGMICWGTTDKLYREIIGCKLSKPLEIGNIYYCSFKTSWSIGGEMANYVASNGLGVKLTTKEYNESNPIAIDNKPMFYSSKIITDTNWIILSGSFVADSAYKYLAIGNFLDSAHTDTLHLGWYIFRSYYFVDDVCLSDNINGCLVGIDEKLNNTEFFVYPNPANKFIDIKSTKNISSIEIYNVLGETFYSSEKMINKNNEINTINCSQFPKGMYFIKIYYNNLYKINKIIIN